MKKRALILFVVLGLLLMTGFVFGAEKDLSVSIQVVENNSSNANKNNPANTGELGSLNINLEKELPISNSQNLINRIFSNGVQGQLLSLKIEKNSIIFIFSFLAIFLFMVYIILLISKIKRVVKKKKSFRKNSKYL